MQLFQFIFLNKEKTLQKSGLYNTAKAAVEHDLPFSLLLFPEGTLVSRLTRPKSASFAVAQGIVSFLLPSRGSRIDRADTDRRSLSLPITSNNSRISPTSSSRARPDSSTASAPSLSPCPLSPSTT
jgi:1-acyl-sn-glycerol-3-phosphate acyltransferase